MGDKFLFRKRWVVLAVLTTVTLLACRTAELITQAQAPRVAEHFTATPSNATRAATRRPPTLARPTQAPSPTPREIIPTEPPPTELPPPTPPPPPTATRKPGATRKPVPTLSPTPAGPTETPAPTRCPQQYCVVYRGCQPDAGNTIVEGVVYKNGAPENGVAVRVSKAQGAYPEVDDFLSGTDPINPGKPDPNNPGHYFLQIAAGAAREGNWWIFVVDRPNGTKQISEAKLIHTDQDANSPTSCQHAFVDFVR